MKNLTALIILIALIGGLSQARGQAQFQGPADQSIRFGVKAGLGQAGFTGSDARGAGHSERLGWTAGAFATIPVYQTLSLQPEWIISRKGSEVLVQPDPEEISIYNLRIDLLYTDIPVLLRWDVNPGTTVNANFIGGGYGGYLLQAQQTLEDEGGESEDIPDIMNDFNFGFIIGFGMEYAFEQLGGVFLDLRLTNGLRDIMDEDASEDSPNYRTSLLSVSAGIRF